MRKFCGSLLSFLVVISISFAAAIAVTAIISNLMNKASTKEANIDSDPRPRLFSILNMFAVCMKRLFTRPDIWVAYQIKTQCPCKGDVDKKGDGWSCKAGDPCHPGFEWKLPAS